MSEQLPDSVEPPPLLYSPSFDHGLMFLTAPEGQVIFDIDCHSSFSGRLLKVFGGVFWEPDHALGDPLPIYLGRLAAVRFEIPMRLVEIYLDLYPATSAHVKAAWIWEAGRARNILPWLARDIARALDAVLLNTNCKEPFSMGRPKKEDECQAPKELPNGIVVTCKRRVNHSGPHTSGQYTWRSTTDEDS